MSMDTAELCSLVERGEPIELDDDQLKAVALAATEELRRRMPRYALYAGDLELTSEPIVVSREAARDAVEAIQ